MMSEIRDAKNREVLDAWRTMGYIRWWLVHGCERTGTTFLTRLISLEAKLKIGDWGLAGVLTLPKENHKRVAFDRGRHLRDVSANVLSNAKPAKGGAVDLVYKQASLRRPEFDSLVSMWGAPERIIYCYRDPAGYINSARKKFPDKSLEYLQEHYCKSLDERYEEVGGELFHYGPHLTTNAIQSFLAPLHVEETDIEFQYKGDDDKRAVSSGMEESFERFCERWAKKN